MRVEVSLFEDNVRPFLTALGWIVGGRLDDDDFEAVGWALRNTDREQGHWFEYEFSGEVRTPFAVAFDEAGASIVWVRAEVPAEFAPRVQLLADFCWHFHWRG